LEAQLTAGNRQRARGAKPRQAQSPRREAKDVEFPDPATMGAAESANSAQSGHQVNSIGFSRENIEERLTMRAVMEQLRSAGVDAGGPAPYSPRDSKTFAGQLDRFLARHRAPPGAAV
jgi:hypothetical protein